MAEAEKVTRGHTAVVYFHGIGSQRRYEETARLVERLDSYLSMDHMIGGERGVLRSIVPRVELSSELDEPVTYIDSRRIPVLGNYDIPSDRIRFYEAYWADVMAEPRGVTDVLRWMVSQVIRPIATVRTPWRERQRLRRSHLIELWQSKSDWPNGVTEEDFKEILESYAEFDSSSRIIEEARLRAVDPKVGGDFHSFLELLAKEDEARKESKGDKHDPDRLDRLTALAELWKSRYQWKEWENLFTLAGMFLALALATYLIASVIFWIFRMAPGVLEWFGIEGLSGLLPSWATANWGNALSLAFGFLFSVVLGNALVQRISDVERWSTYSETDEKFRKRQEVLNRSIKLLSHVVSQQGCNRVIVIGHSLGTSVAYDTLLAAVHENKAHNPSDPTEGRLDFSKISHFVTLASPVDKIEYFFESFRSDFRRYRRIYNEVRGDIGTEPFTRSGGQLAIHWVNIWDQLDVISGPLQSPAPQRIRENRRNQPLALVDNVHVNTMAYFAPGTAHSAYFDNRTVVDILSDIIFFDKGSYRAEKLDFRIVDGRKSGLDYRGSDFGPGDVTRPWKNTLIASVLAPYFGAVAFVGSYFLSGMALAVLILAASVPTLVVLFQVVGRRAMIQNKYADPLELRKASPDSKALQWCGDEPVSG
ncbi:MAG: hypothetical protein AAGF58_00155 [Pseudomonadota bacterium]